jgi:hypothetical protein
VKAHLDLEISMRTRLLAAAVAALALTASPAGAAGFRATLHAPDHHPKAGTKHWIIKVTARTASGTPLRAKAYYQFLFRGRVVSTQYPAPFKPTGSRHSPWSFRGSYRDAILWPKRAVGFPLTFRVVVTVKGRGTRKLDWAVQVHK